MTLVYYQPMPAISYQQQMRFCCLQPRTFMALGAWLMSMDVPENTRAAWQKLM